MLVVIVLSASVGVMTAAADGSVASLNAASVPFIDNQAHTLQPNADAWYRFNYTVSDPANRPVTSIRLLYGNKSGVNFEVWTADEANDIVNNSPIGRGEPYNVVCDDGICQSDDLIWVGAFGSSGTYFVHVINTNATATTAKLLISGDGVSLAPAPIAVTGPATNVQPPATTDDPAKAVVLNGAQQTISANSAMWFRFDYGLNDDGTRPVKTITLANGNLNGLTFQVYAPELVSDWQDNHPTGVGAPIMVACDSGLCASNDLVWQGAFGSTGTYFVRVINNSGQAVPAVLTIQ
jgi:hypothetical protein